MRIAAVIVAVLLFGVIGRWLLMPLFFAGRAADVVQTQLDPVVLQKRYEWFKDAAAACEQKLATARVYKARFNALKHEYGADSTNRRAWSREDREQWSIWQSEAAGITASYNDLAATYNAQMAKWNYRFTNRGDLPQGATEPLPREFKPYVEE